MSKGKAESIGRYALFEEIASGGMATVYFGRQLGLAGFARTVAIKRLHAHLAKDPEFVAMFLDEARLASRIRHPNVVATLDVATDNGELIIVMDYVHGESLSGLVATLERNQERIPLAILTSIVTQALSGLHAAHEAKSEGGAPLTLVHRDVSPQNILVGLDGLARVVDFGVAKAQGRARSTNDGSVKGKVAYMAPEQLRGDRVDRRTDIFAMGVVLWEMLAGRRMISTDNYAQAVAKILFEPLPKLREVAPDVPESLLCVVDRALERDPDLRFESARDMASALEAAVAPAFVTTVGEWVATLAADAIAFRAEAISKVERASLWQVDGGSLPPSGSASPFAAAVPINSAPPSQLDTAPVFGNPPSSTGLAGRAWSAAVTETSLSPILVDKAADADVAGGDDVVSPTLLAEGQPSPREAAHARDHSPAEAPAAPVAASRVPGRSPARRSMVAFVVLLGVAGGVAGVLAAVRGSKDVPIRSTVEPSVVATVEDAGAAFVALAPASAPRTEVSAPPAADPVARPRPVTPPIGSAVSVRPAMDRPASGVARPTPSSAPLPPAEKKPVPARPTAPCIYKDESGLEVYNPACAK